MYVKLNCHNLTMLDLLQILELILKSQNKEIDWTVEAIKTECEACIIPPFWYTVQNSYCSTKSKYEEGLDNLQQLLETVKHAAAAAASSNQSHRCVSADLGLTR